MRSVIRSSLIYHLFWADDGWRAGRQFQIATMCQNTLSARSYLFICAGTGDEKPLYSRDRFVSTVPSKMWTNVQVFLSKRLCEGLNKIIGHYVGYSSMFRRFYVQKVLCSEGPMFRRFYVQKVLYSEGSMFRRSYVQKYLFRRSYVQKVGVTTAHDVFATFKQRQWRWFNVAKTLCAQWVFPSLNEVW